MKSKIGTILLVIVLMVLVAACSILGVKYVDTKKELKELKETSQTTEVEEQNATEPETKGEVIATTTYAIAKLDTSKVDNSKRDNITEVEQSGKLVVESNDFRYIVGPRKVYTSNTTPEEWPFSIRYGEENYVLDSNIVQVETMQHNVSSEFYIFALTEDGKLHYGLKNLDITRIDFKEYTELDDVVRLVYVGGNGRGFALGAITADGVTHLLPYDMP